MEDTVELFPLVSIKINTYFILMETPHAISCQHTSNNVHCNIKHGHCGK